MLKLESYPYYKNEKNIHGHIMTMGQLQLLIIKAFKEKKLSDDVEIRLVECDSGDMSMYTIDQWILHDFNECFPVLVWDIHMIHMNDTGKDRVIINVSDDDHEIEGDK